MIVHVHHAGNISGTFESDGTTTVWYNTQFLWQPLADLSITFALMSARRLHRQW